MHHNISITYATFETHTCNSYVSDVYVLYRQREFYPNLVHIHLSEFTDLISNYSRIRLASFIVFFYKADQVTAG